MLIRYFSEGNDYAIGGCCAAACLRNFPYDNNHRVAAYKSAQTYLKGKNGKEDQEKVLDFCSQARFQGKSLVVATVNSQQTRSAALLEACGFVCPQEDWAYRDKNRNGSVYGVRVYVKAIVPNSDENSWGFEEAKPEV